MQTASRNKILSVFQVVPARLFAIKIPFLPIHYNHYFDGKGNKCYLPFLYSFTN